VRKYSVPGMTPSGQNTQPASAASGALNSRLILLRDDVQTLLLGLKKIGEEIQTYGGPRVQSDVELRKRAVGHLKAIDDLFKSDPSRTSQQAWSEYHRIRDEVTQVNQEVLEMMAGLAIHRENVDAKICWIVRQFLEEISAGQLGLTVFTARDLNFPTLARLTRVRFPVKSVWTLPLAAHQFANLQIKDAPDVEAFAKAAAKKEIESAMSQAEGESPQGEVLRRKTEAKAYSRWIQLMSDSLAVFFTGPCYAASAILMRLSPLGVELDDDSQISDIDRAFVMLETLRQVDVGIDGEDRPYTPVIDWLDGRWNAMLDAAGSAGPSPERVRELAGFVHDLARLADQKLAYAKYPLIPADYYKSGGWSTARQWALKWSPELKQQVALTTPDLTDAGTVRDAFNAGWLAFSRTSGDPGAANAIATVVMDICDTIVRPYYEPLAKTAPAGPPGARARPGV
jgi:hypothetical protein